MYLPFWHSSSMNQSMMCALLLRCQYRYVGLIQMQVYNRRWYPCDKLPKSKEKLITAKVAYVPKTLIPSASELHELLHSIRNRKA